jgi:GTP-binding protein
VNTQRAEFVKSAAAPADFIRDGRPGVVFAGRSNVGKSSVINRLLQRRNFARVSTSPGKTAHVNYFLIDDSLWFIDLPGYGYARVSEAEKRRWAGLMERFFAEPEHISLGILIVDARHRPSRDDEAMAAYFLSSGRSFAVVANKCDKLKSSEREPSLRVIRETLFLPETVPVLPFSAEKGAGREELLARIEDLLQPRADAAES